MSRLYVYAAIALALAGAFGYVWHLHGKAGERDAYKAQAEQADARAVALSETYAKARLADERDSAALAEIRAQQAADSLTFAQALKAKPLVREVVREVNGVPVSCPERDPVRYLELFNLAVDPASNSR